MANAKTAAEAILGESVSSDVAIASEKAAIYEKKGILAEPETIGHECDRCLGCATVCENCVDVCPNRANISIKVPGMEMEQVIHVDYMCNECGNCNSFCPYASAPYQSKFTLFASQADMEDSKNDGFVVLDAVKHEYQVRFLGNISTVKPEDGNIPSGIVDIMNAVCDDYGYLIP